jgi:hypothetical protein
MQICASENTEICTSKHLGHYYIVPTRSPLVGLTECTICLSEFGRGEEVMLLPCGHLFHKSEIVEWLLGVRRVVCRFLLDRGQTLMRDDSARLVERVLQSILVLLLLLITRYWPHRHWPHQPHQLRCCRPSWRRPGCGVLQLALEHLGLDVVPSSPPLYSSIFDSYPPWF